MLRLDWVNHASFVVDAPGVRLISDPWLSGAAFNQGWDLICKSKFSVGDFDNITHIWFSHEHPDHFAPQILKSIPVETRKKIEILYHETPVKKVLEFCKSLGFKTRELPDTKAVSLSEDFHVTCGKVPFFDSWLLIEARGKKILNMNDCVVDTVSKAKKISSVTGAVDVILSQFSYANWIGNKEDEAERKVAAKRKLGVFKTQCDVFKPKFAIPFASFHYFSHEDNFYLNDSITGVDKAVQFISENTEALPLVLYPGQSWEMTGSPPPNEIAIEAYRKDYETALRSLPKKSESVPAEKIFESSRKYVQRISAKNSVFLIRFLTWFGFFTPIYIRLSDLDKLYSFNLLSGISETNSGQPMITMRSDSLAYILNFEWGFDTVFVSGRLETDRKYFPLLVRTFSIATMNNIGESLSFSFLFNWRLFVRAVVKLLQIKEKEL